MSLPKCESNPTLRRIPGCDATLESIITRVPGCKPTYRYTVWRGGEKLGTIRRDGGNYWAYGAKFDYNDPVARERTLMAAAATLANRVDPATYGGRGGDC